MSYLPFNPPDHNRVNYSSSSSISFSHSTLAQPTVDTCSVPTVPMTPRGRDMTKAGAPPWSAQSKLQDARGDVGAEGCTNRRNQSLSVITRILKRASRTATTKFDEHDQTPSTGAAQTCETSLPANVTTKPEVPPSPPPVLVTGSSESTTPDSCPPPNRRPPFRDPLGNRHMGTAKLNTAKLDSTLRGGMQQPTQIKTQSTISYILSRSLRYGNNNAAKTSSVNRSRTEPPSLRQLSRNNGASYAKRSRDILVRPGDVLQRPGYRMSLSLPPTSAEQRLNQPRCVCVNKKNNEERVCACCTSGGRLCERADRCGCCVMRWSTAGYIPTITEVTETELSSCGSAIDMPARFCGTSEGGSEEGVKNWNGDERGREELRSYEDGGDSTCLPSTRDYDSIRLITGDPITLLPTAQSLQPMAVVPQTRYPSQWTDCFAPSVPRAAPSQWLASSPAAEIDCRINKVFVLPPPRAVSHCEVQSHGIDGEDEASSILVMDDMSDVLCVPVDTNPDGARENETVSTRNVTEELPQTWAPCNANAPPDSLEEQSRASTTVRRSSSDSSYSRIRTGSCKNREGAICGFEPNVALPIDLPPPSSYHRASRGRSAGMPSHRVRGESDRRVSAETSASSKGETPAEKGRKLLREVRRTRAAHIQAVVAGVGGPTHGHGKARIDGNTGSGGAVRNGKQRNGRRIVFTSLGTGGLSWLPFRAGLCYDGNGEANDRARATRSGILDKRARSHSEGVSPAWGVKGSTSEVGRINIRATSCHDSTPCRHCNGTECTCRPGITTAVDSTASCSYCDTNGVSSSSCSTDDHCSTHSSSITPDPDSADVETDIKTTCCAPAMTSTVTRQPLGPAYASSGVHCFPNIKHDDLNAPLQPPRTAANVHSSCLLVKRNSLMPPVIPSTTDELLPSSQSQDSCLYEYCYYYFYNLLTHTKQRLAQPTPPGYEHKPRDLEANEKRDNIPGPKANEKGQLLRVPELLCRDTYTNRNERISAGDGTGDVLNSCSSSGITCSCWTNAKAAEKSGAATLQNPSLKNEYCAVCCRCRPQKQSDTPIAQTTQVAGVEAPAMGSRSDDEVNEMAAMTESNYSLDKTETSPHSALISHAVLRCDSHKVPLTTIGNASCPQRPLPTLSPSSSILCHDPSLHANRSVPVPALRLFSSDAVPTPLSLSSLSTSIGSLAGLLPPSQPGLQKTPPSSIMAGSSCRLPCLSNCLCLPVVHNRPHVHDPWIDSAGVENGSPIELLTPLAQILWSKLSGAGDEKHNGWWCDNTIQSSTHGSIEAVTLLTELLERVVAQGGAERHGGMDGAGDGPANYGQSCNEANNGKEDADIQRTARGRREQDRGATGDRNRSHSAAEGSCSAHQSHQGNLRESRNQQAPGDGSFVGPVFEQDKGSVCVTEIEMDAAGDEEIVNEQSSSSQTPEDVERVNSSDDALETTNVISNGPTDIQTEPPTEHDSTQGTAMWKVEGEKEEAGLADSCRCVIDDANRHCMSPTACSERQEPRTGPFHLGLCVEETEVTDSNGDDVGKESAKDKTKRNCGVGGNAIVQPSRHDSPNHAKACTEGCGGGSMTATQEHAALSLPHTDCRSSGRLTATQTNSINTSVLHNTSGIVRNLISRCKRAHTVSQNVSLPRVPPTKPLRTPSTSISHDTRTIFGQTRKSAAKESSSCRSRLCPPVSDPTDNSTRPDLSLTIPARLCSASPPHDPSGSNEGRCLFPTRGPDIPSPVSSPRTCDAGGCLPNAGLTESSGVCADAHADTHASQPTGGNADLWTLTQKQAQIVPASTACVQAHNNTNYACTAVSNGRLISEQSHAYRTSVIGADVQQLQTHTTDTSYVNSPSPGSASTPSSTLHIPKAVPTLTSPSPTALRPIPLLLPISRVASYYSPHSPSASSLSPSPVSSCVSSSESPITLSPHSSDSNESSPTQHAALTPLVTGLQLPQKMDSSPTSHPNPQHMYSCLFPSRDHDLCTAVSVARNVSRCLLLDALDLGHLCCTRSELFCVDREQQGPQTDGLESERRSSLALPAAFPMQTHGHNSACRSNDYGSHSCWSRRSVMLSSGSVRPYPTVSYPHRDVSIILFSSICSSTCLRLLHLKPRQVKHNFSPSINTLPNQIPRASPESLHPPSAHSMASSSLFACSSCSCWAFSDSKLQNLSKRFIPIVPHASSHSSHPHGHLDRTPSIFVHPPASPPLRCTAQGVCSLSAGTSSDHPGLLYANGTAESLGLSDRGPSTMLPISYSSSFSKCELARRSCDPSTGTLLVRSTTVCTRSHTDMTLASNHADTAAAGDKRAVGTVCGVSSPRRHRRRHTDSMSSSNGFHNDRPHAISKTKKKKKRPRKMVRFAETVDVCWPRDVDEMTSVYSLPGDTNRDRRGIGWGPLAGLLDGEDCPEIEGIPSTQR
eukprot:GHVQ01040911.1.p1 GENE.GHVQ01040911.1~~GHVQ01040911.1.p1  ORF type:complete len:2398 (+),score=285.75 GHVQ01040911.1:1393-8586(+)